MSMNLFYIEGCDQDYEPPGFCSSDSDKLFFPDDENWKLVRFTAGSLKTSYHEYDCEQQIHQL